MDSACWKFTGDYCVTFLKVRIKIFSVFLTFSFLSFISFPPAPRPYAWWTESALLVTTVSQKKRHSSGFSTPFRLPCMVPTSAYGIRNRTTATTNILKIQCSFWKSYLKEFKLYCSYCIIFVTATSIILPSYRKLLTPPNPSYSQLSTQYYYHHDILFLIYSLSSTNVNFIRKAFFLFIFVLLLNPPYSQT